MYLLLAFVCFVFCCNAFNEISTVTRFSHPQIIGHAGASGYVPESSLIGYDLAANLFADYSEPDLVLSKDNVFFAFHDLTLEVHVIMLTVIFVCFYKQF